MRLACFRAWGSNLANSACSFHLVGIGSGAGKGSAELTYYRLEGGIHLLEIPQELWYTKYHPGLLGEWFLCHHYILEDRLFLLKLLVGDQHKRKPQEGETDV